MLFWSSVGCEGMGLVIFIYVIILSLAIALSNLFGNICQKIAYKKNRFNRGYYWLGFWTFPVGLIIVACLPTIDLKKHKKSTSPKKIDKFYLNNIDVKILSDGYKQLYESNEISFDMYKDNISRIMTFYAGNDKINNTVKSNVNSSSSEKYAHLTSNNDSITLIVEDSSLSLDEKRARLRCLLDSGKISSPQYSEAMKNIRKNA